jgi:hypothetical protein
MPSEGGLFSSIANAKYRGYRYFLQLAGNKAI